MDRFVVGTGRCGSTLLSRMLAEQPQTLSVFEYFNGLDAARRFTREPLRTVCLCPACTARALGETAMS